ncbi:MAG: Ni/Fe-hydrogenase cytochrome b subunit [Nitrospiraceae bacterium]|nr:Ni/Fe-hydrogenase cytochrome b subunit [Nitrospiraceae bacterium]
MKALDKTMKDVQFFSKGTKILVVLLGLAAIAVIYRYVFGLGGATNLSDDVPWGLWVAFDVFAGVALAAGGFAVTAAVYIFNMKKYKPIARPAILTAFIGYSVVMLGLLIDIGQSQRFWHPLLMWQHRSVMFEVVICITLYSNVLALEFAPAVLEKLKLTGLLKILKFFTFPLVIAGIVLSFLHQSSLGAFFLIMPARLSQLWYSPIMPQMFYISAIAVGLAMVSFESIVSAKAFKKEYEMDILKGLGKGTRITLGIYLLVKIIDMIVRGTFPMLLDGSLASKFYIAEILIGAIIPIILYSIKSTQESVGGILTSSSFVIFGVLFNRFNINFFAQLRPGISYFPSVAEIAITVGLVALGIFAYRIAAVYFPVMHDSQEQH